MGTLTAHNHGIKIAHQRVGPTDDPLLLIMGTGAAMLYCRDHFC
ncbi:hypothetical protein GCM10023161_30540 [Mycobacterium paraffinicum]|uniref:Uncharacterized protein n=1 Tax=Mycobacterium paraffinicum TaxID=53378 RepID=A0ABP8RP93_9MYCO